MTEHPLGTQRYHPWDLWEARKDVSREDELLMARDGRKKKSKNNSYWDTFSHVSGAGVARCTGTNALRKFLRDGLWKTKLCEESEHDVFLESLTEQARNPCEGSERDFFLKPDETGTEILRGVQA